MSKMSCLEPHDIIKVSRKAQSFMIASLSDIGQGYWQRSPYHVVRRAVVPNDGNGDLIPIGVRGNDRHERFGIYIPHEWVEEVVTPISLMQNQKWLQWERSDKFLAIIETLNILATYLASYPIGIGGSLGYELTSGIFAVKEASDIDLILYSHKLFSKSLTIRQAQEIIEISNTCSVLVDIQVQNKRGAFHLQEYVNNPNEAILLKSNQGPILSKDIW